MAYSLTLPNGAVINNIPDNISRNQALDMIKGKMPDAFPEPPGVLSQLVRAPLEIGKGFVRGLTTDPLSGISSLAYTGARAAGAELTPFEQTAFGRGLGEAQTALAPSDTGLITQFAGGLGSLASFIPGGLLKGGIRLATLGTQAAGLGSEEARARAEQARLEGKEVTPEQQFQAQAMGTGIGLTELAPVGRLVQPIEAILRGVKRSDADAIAPGLFNSARRILETGGIEAFQEGMANVLQDLVQKGVYDPNLEVGESALGDAAMGGAVGSFAQGAIELVTRGKRRDIYERLKAQEREQELQDRLAKLQSEEQEQIARTKTNLGIPEETLLALPAPAAPVIDTPTQDPLANPLGNFTVGELTTGISDFINAKRKRDGQSILDSFSIEDIADAGAPQAEIDRIIAGKLSQQGVNVEEGLAQNPSEQDVRNLAQSKGISTDTPGYRHFLSRTTGVEDYGSMSPVQRLAAFNALQNVEEGGILPLGTNAKRFTNQQYDKVKSSIPTLFKDSDTLSPTSVVEQVKKMTGLKSDRDARSLLDTAIRNGELSTAATPVFEVVKDGVILRKYNTRKAAAESADRLNATVRNSTVTDFALPGTLKELPGGPDIRAGRFEAGVEPAGFDIKDASGKTLGGAATQAEAEAKATRFAATRQGEANRLQEEIQKVKEQIGKTQQRLEAMEATGQGGTVGFAKLQADAFAQAKEAQRKIEELSAQQAALAEPLSINSKGTRPVSREGYTFFQDGQPRGTFPTKEAAEEAAIQSYDDAFLERIANTGDQQRGLMPKRLASMARNELARRRGELPQGFGIQYTGTPEQAEAKLAQAGVFTAKTQEQIRELEKKLLPAMKRLGLENVGLRIIKAIESGQGSADGFYASRLITIALDAVDPMGTLRHESIHALKQLGAFKPNEWKLLEKKAKEEWIDKFLKDRFTAQGVSLFDAYKAIYEQDNGSLSGFDAYITEEAIADAFKYFNQTKPPAGLIANLMYRLKQFFSALENAFKGLGFQTAEDVFTRTEEGRVQAISPATQSGAGKFGLRADQSATMEATGDKTPLSMDGIRIYERELQGLIKKVGDRIAGMDSTKTLEDVRKAVKKLQSYTKQGLEGKEWYERSAQAVLEAFNGDPVLAEKFFQVIAITSANTEVAANFTKASNAWEQFATGRPIKAGTKRENDAIDDLLNFGLDWDGRKTNTFYINLMEAMEGTDTGRSTIDLHMSRMLFDRDSPTDAQYQLGENMVRLLASKVGIPARQVQAASWVTQKAKKMFDDYRERGLKRNMSDEELRNHAFQRALMDYAHLSKSKGFNPTVTPELLEPSASKRARTQVVTGEVIPTTKGFMSQVAELPMNIKEKLTKNIMSESFIQDIGKALGLTSKIRVAQGTGGYDGGISPNLIVRLINPDPTVAVQEARDLSDAMSYVFQQDATPFFRADPALLGQGQLGYRFRFGRAELTPTQERKIFAAMREEVGNDVGYSKTKDNDIVVINYRGEDGNPFLMDDNSFADAMNRFREKADQIVPIEDASVFGAESEYRYNEWNEPTTGQSIIDGLQGRRPERPNLSGQLTGLRDAFVKQARSAVRESGGTPRFQLRSSEFVSGPGPDGGLVLGTKQPGAKSFTGIHYGKQQVNTLAGSRYGTGIKGQEAARLAEAKDPRIKKRVYFYIPFPQGMMPPVEAGLGQYVYRQRFGNILPPGDEMTSLYNASEGDYNRFESSVIDAGYDGYAVPNMGMMVIMNHDVPVDYLGTRQELKGTVNLLGNQYSLRAVNTPEFKQWFGSSTITNPDGTPKVMYHGTARDIETFKPKQANAIFVTNTPKFAGFFTDNSEIFMAKELYASLSDKEKDSITSKAKKIAKKEGTNIDDELMSLLRDQLPTRANIMPLYVRAEKPFDYENPDHVSTVQNAFKTSTFYTNLTKNQQPFYDRIYDRLEDGDWSDIENSSVQKIIRDLGFDSFYVREGYQKNLAVYDPNQIKSAVGNFGAFSRTNNDIRYSLALAGINPQSSLVPDEGGDYLGRLGMQPQKLGGKPINLLIGTHNDLIDELKNEKMYRPVSYGANHILNRVLNNPRRDPGGAQELLERIVRKAQQIARNYSRVYKEGNKLIFFAGNDSLITMEDGSIVTMYRQFDPERKYGNPIWFGRAPAVTDSKPPKGLPVRERDGLVSPKDVETAEKVKRVYTPMDIEELSAAYVEPKKGTLGLKKTAYSLRSTETPEFKQWFKNSPVVNAAGKPQMMFHGTSLDIEEFIPGETGAIYVSPDPGFAGTFAKYSQEREIRKLGKNIDEDLETKQRLLDPIIDKAMATGDLNNRDLPYHQRLAQIGLIKDLDQYSKDYWMNWFLSMPMRDAATSVGVGPALREALANMLTTGRNVMPLYVNPQKPFDYDNNAHVNKVAKLVFEYDPDTYQSGNPAIQKYRRNALLNGLKMGDWRTLEQPEVQEAIKELGFDAFYVKEQDTKNIGLYRPSQLKSAIGNVGAYGQRDPTIDEAKQLGLTIEEARSAQKRGDVRFSLRENKDPAYHSGDLRYGRDTTLGRMTGGRSTGHFGTGVYFLSKPPKAPTSERAKLLDIRADRPVQAVDFSQFNLLTPLAEFEAENLHKALRFANDLVDAKFDFEDLEAPSPTRDTKGVSLGRAINRAVDDIQLAANSTRNLKKLGRDEFSKQEIRQAFIDGVKEAQSLIDQYRYRSDYVDSASTRVIKNLGFDGIDVRGLDKFDNNEYGSVIYAEEVAPAPKPRYSLRESIDPTVVDAIDRTTTTRQNQGFGDRMAEAISPTGFTKFRQGFINKYERIAQISRTVAKKFGDQELLADQSAIAAALMSDRASGVAAEAFKRGIPVYDKGYTYVTDMEGQQKGLMQILMPLAERGDPFVYQAFQFYAASKRGKRLDAEGRERLFTPEDMKKAALLEREFPEFKQVFDEYQKFNKGLVDYMKDTGVIDAEMARKWTENWDYIPFYRQLDGERTAGPNIFQSIAGVALPKKLKGGEAPLADFLETITRNTRAAIEAGMKNVAANRVVRDMKRLNDPGGTAPMIEEIKPGERLGPDSITVRENGKTKNYRVADPLLIESLKGLNIPQLPFLEVLAKPAQVLRELVTKDPGFMMANLLRDSLQAWGIGNQIVPVVDTFKQYGKVLANMSPEAQKLMRAGIGTGYEFKGDVQATTEEFARQLRVAAGQRTAGEKAALPLTKAWDLLDQASTASDLATRAEVFKRTMEETNGNEAEAVFQAMEVMNFSRKGSNPIIQIAAAAIPFLNARIQGLDVLYRAGTGQLSARNAAARQKAFFVRGMTMMALSSLYWMLASETEEWQTAEQETRDNNWIIGPVRIPIPFELGVIFKVAPERILEYTFGDDTTKDLKMSFVRNLTSTLAVNPIPQAILPIVENVANYSFFTGQPIVGRGLEDVSKPFQVNTGTSLFAAKAGESLGLSPVQIDNLIRGYTGTLGGYAVMALDAVMRGQGDPTKATMGAEQLPVVKRFFASPESTGTVTQFYELKNKLDEVTRTINFLERAGKFDQMAEYMKENAMMVSMTPYIRTLEKEINMLRDTKRVVNNSQMEPDQKREVLDAIRSAEVNLTRNIQSVRKLVD